MMKKKYLFILLCCCSILFTACPYNAPVSIDDPKAMRVEHKLVGKWKQPTSEDETFIVKELDDHTYSIVEKHKKTEGSEKQDDEVYNGFLSEVEGVKFLNLFKPDEDPKSYYFYKIELNDETGGFTLYPITEYITEKFSTSDDLKKFIKQYKNLSFFYGSKEEYVKN